MTPRRNCKGITRDTWSWIKTLFGWNNMEGKEGEQQQLIQVSLFGYDMDLARRKGGKITSEIFLIIFRTKIKLELLRVQDEKGLVDPSHISTNLICKASWISNVRILTY